MEKQKIIKILEDIAERHYLRGWTDNEFDLEKDWAGPSSEKEAEWSYEAILPHMESQENDPDKPQLCNQYFGNVFCDKFKGHKGCHSGNWRTHPARRVDWSYGE